MGLKACWLVLLLVTGGSVPQHLYHHQFAVHVPAGPDVVDDLAHRHGFLNHGQVSLMKWFEFSYLQNIEYKPHSNRVGSLGQFYLSYVRL